MSLMIDGWMPSVGSSRISSFGPMASARRDRQLLLLPARQVAAAPAHIWLQHREHLENLAPVLGGGRGSAANPDPQVFLHRQAREDLASLRHIADAGADALRAMRCA